MRTIVCQSFLFFNLRARITGFMVGLSLFGIIVTAKPTSDIVKQLERNHAEPEIAVGVVLKDDKDQWLKMEIPAGMYRVNSKKVTVRREVPWYVRAERSLISISAGGREIVKEQPLVELEPLPPHTGVWVKLKNLRIGRGDTRETRRDMSFSGRLHLRAEEQLLEVNNVVPVEEYLLGVVNAELGIGNGLEALKAQAIASRSWALSAAIDPHPSRSMNRCNDNHCQRFEGIGKIRDAVRTAVEATRGQVLVVDGKILDANYSASCGGILESPVTIWGSDKPAHRARFDGPDDSSARSFYPIQESMLREYLTGEWIKNSDLYCAPRNGGSQAINGKAHGVRVTGNAFRWTVTYSQQELTSLLKMKMPKQFGSIESVVDLKPFNRGPSGRMSGLEVEVLGAGGLRQIRIEKEPQIRYVLHPGVLYSSAVIVDREPDGARIPERFVFHGAGWGHGVGMCQYGAMGMAQRGLPVQAILQHYYPGASIERLYP